MMKKSLKFLIACSMVVVLAVIAGCGGGGSGAQRVKGLSPDGVVKTFFTAVQDNKIKDAGLYVSPASTSDAKTVAKYITGQSDLTQLKDANLLSVKVVAQQGDYAAVMATLQAKQDSLQITVKPLGLERINGEWYIVDFDQIYNNAKYNILKQLLAKI